MSKLFKNHIAYQYTSSLADEIDKLWEPFSQISGMNKFSHIRIFKDWKYLMHTNVENSFLQDYIINSKGIGEDFADQMTKILLNTPYFYCWPILKQNDFYDFLRYHNLWNGLSVYVKSSDYVDIYDFTPTQENCDAKHFLLNNRTFVHDFIKIYTHRYKHTIDNHSEEIRGTLGCKKPIDPEANTSNQNRYLLQEQKDKLLVDKKGKTIIVTHRQYECAYYLSIGKTAKEMAIILGLSHRTVEKHIDQLKEKLDLYSKSELMSLAIDNFRF